MTSGTIDITTLEMVAEPTDEYPGGHWLAECRVLDGTGAELGTVERRFEPSYPVAEIPKALAQTAKAMIDAAHVTSPGLELQIDDLLGG